MCASRVREDRLNESRVLVTGGAGFVGSNLVARLLDLGCRVTVLDDLSTGKRHLLPSHPNLTLVEGDVRNYDLLKNLIADTEIIFHEAARNIIVSSARPREDQEVNVGGTMNVLVAARDSSADALVYASSASIYGNARGLLLAEEEPPMPLSVYAAGKLAAEQYCSAFYEVYGLPVTMLRYFNVYGPNQSPENPYAGVVSKFFNHTLSGKPPEIHGNGQQTRDFTYVSDAVEATVLAATADGSKGELFNVGTGVETSIVRLAHEIIDLSGMNGKLQPIYIPRRDIDNVRRRCANIEKIRRKLRWEPTVELSHGLRLTLDWIKGSLQPA